MVITCIETIICEIVNYTMQTILFKSTIDLLAFGRIIFIELLFNTMIIIIIYPILIKMGELIERVFTEDKTLTRYY